MPPHAALQLELPIGPKQQRRIHQQQPGSGAQQEGLKLKPATSGRGEDEEEGPDSDDEPDDSDSEQGAEDGADGAAAGALAVAWCLAQGLARGRCLAWLGPIPCWERSRL